MGNDTNVPISNALAWSDLVVMFAAAEVLISISGNDGLFPPRDLEFLHFL